MVSDKIKALFGRKKEEQPQTLRIEGVPDAPFTPEPDDAELAAQALLEMMAANGGGKKKRRHNDVSKSRNDDKAAPVPGDSVAGEKSAAYYRALAERIREAHRRAERQATRFIYNCELMLQNRHLPAYGEGSLAMLEAELYKRIDIIDRAGGELKRRWQHCLADVTVRLMEAPPPPAPKESPVGE